MHDRRFLADYGEMARLVAKEYANGDRDDKRFPFLRTFDVWEGHSWAGGMSPPGGDKLRTKRRKWPSCTTWPTPCAGWAASIGTVIPAPRRRRRSLLTRPRGRRSYVVWNPGPSPKVVDVYEKGACIGQITAAAQALTRATRLSPPAGTAE